MVKLQGTLGELKCLYVETILVVNLVNHLSLEISDPLSSLLLVLT